MSYTVAYLTVAAAIVAGLVAFGFALRALLEALRDRAAIRRAGIGNGRRLVAARAVRAEQARSLAVALIVAGLTVLIVAQPTPSPDADLHVSGVTVVTLVSIAAALVVLAVDGAAARRATRRLDEELRRGHANRDRDRHEDTGELRAHTRDAQHIDGGARP